MKQKINKSTAKVVVYSPLTNQDKPFKYQNKRYNRNELNAMGLSFECKAAILEKSLK